MTTEPWLNEPNRMEWRHEGVPCLIVRNQFGALCGYASCYPGHPWYRMKYEDVPAAAHGGVNFSDHCSGEICHVPEPGEPDEVWWLGFACMAYKDFVPMLHANQALDLGPIGIRTYRTISFVKQVCELLADQIRAIGAVTGRAVR